MSYVDIVKNYKPPVVKGFLTVITHDMPIQWVVLIENGKCFNAFRLGHDESVKLEDCETWVTIKSSSDNFSFTKNASNEDGITQVLERTTYDGVEVKIRVRKTSSVEKHWDFKTAQNKHDRILSLKGEKFYVQSGCLSIWSDYFERMFNGHFAEREKNEIIIEDVEPADFEELLKVIHPTRKEINETNVVALWKLADRLDFPNVVTLCEEFLTTAPGFYLLPLMEKFDLAQAMRSEKLEKKCRDVMMRMSKG